MISYNGFAIKPHRQYPNSYEITKEGNGGSIPEVFDTLFTSIGIAKSFIDSYVERRGAKPYARKAKPEG